MLNHWHGASRAYWLKTRKHGMVYLNRLEHVWDHIQDWIETLFKYIQTMGKAKVIRHMMKHITDGLKICIPPCRFILNNAGS